MQEPFEDWFAKQPIGQEAYAPILSALSFEGKDIDVIIKEAYEAGLKEGYGEGKKDGLLNVPQIAKSQLMKRLFGELDRWRAKWDQYGINYPGTSKDYEKIKSEYNK